MMPTNADRFEGAHRRPIGSPIGVKICGIRERSAFDAACEAGADWIGFVFFARSPRCVTPQTVATLLRSEKKARPQTVGLFVKADDSTIERTLSVADLDILQIYDTPARALEIRQKFKRPVWLSCAVTTPIDLPENTMLDGYVIEPRAPADAALPGGNGITLDWSLLRHWQAPSPWMLAGGLTPDNVARALAMSHAPAVDVSSGVETAPGEKSPELVRNFIKNVRGYCAANKR